MFGASFFCGSKFNSISPLRVLILVVYVWINLSICFLTDNLFLDYCLISLQSMLGFFFFFRWPCLRAFDRARGLSRIPSNPYSYLFTFFSIFLPDILLLAFFPFELVSFLPPLPCPQISSPLARVPGVRVHLCPSIFAVAPVLVLLYEALRKSGACWHCSLSSISLGERICMMNFKTKYLVFI